MLYLNKQRFVQNIDFSSLIGRPCKNTFVDGCLQFYLTQKDFSVNMRPNGAYKNTSAPLCFFAQNLPCVTVIDTNFAYVYKFLIQKNNLHTVFEALQKFFATSFRISFYLKIYFWIDVCNAFSNNRTASEMSILPLPPTYAYSVCSKFTHSVHYSGVCPFNNGGIGKKVNDGIFPFYIFGVTNANFCRFPCKFFPKRLFRQTSHII